MTARVPCAPETQEMLREIVDGGGFTYDELLRLLIAMAREDDESNVRLGYRLKGIAIDLESKKPD